MSLPNSLLLTLALGSCSLFNAAEQTTCEFTYQCDECKDLQATFFCQTGEEESSKEAAIQ